MPIKGSGREASDSGNITKSGGELNLQIVTSYSEVFVRFLFAFQNR